MSSLEELQHYPLLKQYERNALQTLHEYYQDQEEKMDEKAHKFDHHIEKFAHKKS